MSYRICKDDSNDPGKKMEKLLAIFGAFAMKINRYMFVGSYVRTREVVKGFS
jgi:hypothetical protein